MYMKRFGYGKDDSKVLHNQYFYDTREPTLREVLKNDFSAFLDLKK